MLWIPGEVQKQLGPVTYQVRTDSGQVWKQHIDHLRGLRNGSHSSQGHSEHEDVDESEYVHINPRDALNEPTSSPTPVVDTPNESSNLPTVIKVDVTPGVQDSLQIVTNLVLDHDYCITSC